MDHSAQEDDAEKITALFRNLEILKEGGMVF